MGDAAIFSLANLVTGALGAAMTGPLGGIDLPDVALAEVLRAEPSGYVAQLSYADGSEAGRIASGGLPVRLQDYPETFLRAVMAAEDKRFGGHGGVDPLATASAAVAALAGNLRGGSTLTQQTVKNLITGSAPNLDRKLAEAVLAVRAHVDLSADEVFTAYLNAAWFGRGVQGAGGAAQAWFGRDWHALSLSEMALLAGMLKGAGHYDPERHPQRAMARRDYVLGRMLELGWITRDEAEAARNEELRVVPARPSEAGDLWAARAAAAEMRERGLPADLRRQTDLGLRLTVDPVWQDIAAQALASRTTSLVPQGPAGRLSAGLLRTLTAAEETDDTLRAVRDEVARRLAAGSGRLRLVLIARNPEGGWHALLDSGRGLPRRIVADASALPTGATLRPGDMLPAALDDEGNLSASLVPGIQGAAVVLDARTGAILASIGGHDPRVSAFDRTRAMRQPGSAIKPFLWLAALDIGYSHDSPVSNSEWDFFVSDGDIWRPQNYDRSQSWDIPLFTALERSANLAAAHIAYTIGIESMAAMAERLGAYPPGGMRRTLSASLGTSEVRLRDLVAAYAGIVNDGVPVQPHVIAAATAGQGAGDAATWEHRAQTGFAAASPRSLIALKGMLRGVVVRGTAYNAFRGHPVTVIGKTGTSQMHRDLWFVGMTPDVAVGVWLGRDDNRRVPGRHVGGTSAAPVVADILRAAHERGLIDGNGMRDGRAAPEGWPPPLLRDGGGWQTGDSALLERLGTGFGPSGDGSLSPEIGDFRPPAAQQGEFVIRSLW